MVITQEYLDALPEVYLEIFCAFPVLKHPNYLNAGIDIQMLKMHLIAHYSSDEMAQACKYLVDGGAATIVDNILYPTDLGQELIERLTEPKRSKSHDIPDFVPPDLHN